MRITEEELNNIIKESIEENFFDRLKGHASSAKNKFVNYMSDKKTNNDMANGYVDAYANNSEKQRNIGKIINMVQQGLDKGWFTGAKTSAAAKQFLYAMKNTLARSASNVSAFNNAAFNIGDKYPSMNDYPSRSYTGNTSNDVTLDRKKPRNEFTYPERKSHLRPTGTFSLREGIDEKALKNIIRESLDTILNKDM